MFNININDHQKLLWPTGEKSKMDISAMAGRRVARSPHSFRARKM